MPPVTFPVALTTPPVVKLPPVTFPVALTSPPVVKFPPVTFPVALTRPEVVKLPPVTLPVALTSPPVVKLPPVTFPVALTRPEVVKLPVEVKLAMLLKFLELSITVVPLIFTLPPTFTPPLMSSFCVGVAVLIPIFPPFATLNAGVVVLTKMS